MSNGDIIMFAPINVNTLGQFVEKSYGKIFEYAAATERHLFPAATGGRNIDYPHVVYVGPFAEERFALVKGTVAYVVVDESDDGSAVIEKWNIKGHRKYK